MNKTKKRILFAFLTAFVITGQCNIVKANEEYIELEEVVVTAEKREENLQKVPLAITAITGNELNDSAVESTSDLQFKAPGFVLTTSGVNGEPYIRGIGSDSISIGSDSKIGVYLDGVYQSRPVAALTDFYDVERVEIVRGPQGTLYGRNSTGGALNIISKIPETDFSVGADLLYGNYNKVRTRAVVNTPVVKDKVFLRLSSLTSNRDGFTKVINRGNTIDDEDLYSVRGQVRVFASESVEILLSADYQKDNGSRFLGPKINGNLPAPAINFFNGTNPEDPREILTNLDNFKKEDMGGGKGKIIWDLESMTLTSITAFRETDYSLLVDLDVTEVDYAISDSLENSKTFTQEFQLSSNSNGPFEWVGGLFYLHENSSQGLDFKLNALGTRLNSYAENLVNAYAAFAQGSYFIHDKWRITAGGRYTHENKHHVINAGQGGPLINNGKKDWDAFMPKFSIDYFPVKNSMTYFSLSRGFKSGGYNSAGVGEEFNPEYIWSYEIGLKSNLFENRLRFNAAAFYYDYKDIQVQRSLAKAPAAFILENAAKAEIKGVEAEILARPFSRLNMNIGVALLDARFTEFISLNPDAPNPTVNQDLSGNRLPKAPELSTHASLQYNMNLNNYGEMFLRGGWKYQSEIFFNQFNSQGVNQKGYSLFNARLGFESNDGNWDFALWVKNITDRLYKQTVLRNTRLVGTLNFWGAPRTFGLQVAYKY